MQSVFKFRKPFWRPVLPLCSHLPALAQISPSVGSPDSAIRESTVNPVAPFAVAVEQVTVSARRREESAQESAGRALGDQHRTDRGDRVLQCRTAHPPYAECAVLPARPIRPTQQSSFAASVPAFRARRRSQDRLQAMFSPAVYPSRAPCATAWFKRHHRQGRQRSKRLLERARSCSIAPMKVSACGLSRTISFSSQQIYAARKASSGYAQPSNPQAKTVFDRHDFQYLSGSALQFRPRSLASWVIRARSASPFGRKAEGPTLRGDASQDGRVPMELSGVLSRSRS